MLEDFGHLSVSMKLRLVPLKTYNKSLYTAETFEEIRKTITTLVAYSAEADICVDSIWAQPIHDEESELGYLYILIPIIVTPRDSPTPREIYNKIHNVLHGKMVQLSVNDMHFQFQLDNRQYTIFKRLSSAIAVKYNGRSLELLQLAPNSLSNDLCIATLELTKFMVCSQIVLEPGTYWGNDSHIVINGSSGRPINWNDVLQVDEDKVTGEELTAVGGGGEGGDHQVRICVEDYLRAVSESSGNQHKLGWTVSIFCALLCCFSAGLLKDLM